MELVFGLEIGQSIEIGGGITVTLLETRASWYGSSAVRLGITAPRTTPIYRREIWVAGAPSLALPKESV